MTFDNSRRNVFFLNITLLLASEVHGSREMAQADHVTPPRSREAVEALCEQNVERDGSGDGLLMFKNSKAR